METEDEAIWETGPFCRHWADPGLCEINCADCGHSCTTHAASEGYTECLIAGCDCKAWKEG